MSDTHKAQEGPCYILSNGECISPFKCLHGDPFPFEEFIARIQSAAREEGRQDAIKTLRKIVDACRRSLGDKTFDDGMQALIKYRADITEDAIWIKTLLSIFQPKP